MTKRDGLLAWLVVNVISGRRHIVAALRKSRMCKCGCRGWCSLWAIWTWIQWCLSLLARGLNPTRRHDGSPWLPSDTIRADPSFGTIGRLVACVCNIKGDWQEIAASLGFPTWADKAHPCPGCFCTHDDWDSCEGVSPIEFPFAEKTQDSYDAACHACEIQVLVSSLHVLRLITSHLEYDKTLSGSRGRSLIADLPTLNLMRKDRLEPSDFVPDIGNLKEDRIPFTATFWRRTSESATRHRNPLFKDRFVTRCEYITVDELHCMNLGIFKPYISKVFNALWRSTPSGLEMCRLSPNGSCQ